MSVRIDFAEMLQDELRALLDAADLTDVLVSLDPRDIASGARAGIVIVMPPDIEFETFTIQNITSELAVIAGTADNLLAAWERLDAILDAITPLETYGQFKTATADSFGVKNGPALPGYTVTLHPVTINVTTEVTP